MLEELRALGSDERGFLGITGMLIIGAIASVLGISLAASINWKFLLAVMVMVVIALGVVGTIWFGVPFDRVIILAILCLSIVTFIQIGALTAVGLIIVGGVMWKWSPYKQPMLYVALVGLGLLAVIWGSEFAIESLGVFP